jgi:hypothetical protein
MPAFHVHHNVASFNLHTIGCSIRPLHVFFMLVLDKGVASGFSCLLFLDNLNILHGPEGFHFAQELALGHFEHESTHKEGIVTIHARKFTTIIPLFFAIGYHLGF